VRSPTECRKYLDPYLDGTDDRKASARSDEIQIISVKREEHIIAVRLGTVARQVGLGPQVKVALNDQPLLVRVIV